MGGVGGVDPLGLRVGFLYSDFFLSFIAWAGAEVRDQKSEVSGQWTVGSGQSDEETGMELKIFRRWGEKNFVGTRSRGGVPIRRDLPRATFFDACGVGTDWKVCPKLFAPAALIAGGTPAVPGSSGLWTLDVGQRKALPDGRATAPICPVATAPGSDKISRQDACAPRSAFRQLVGDGVGAEDLAEDFEHRARIDRD